MKSKSEQLKYSFGKQYVDQKQREKKIRSVFQSVAPRYDLMNDVMSFGMHRWWKKQLVDYFSDTDKSLIVIDLAGGTGDIAKGLSRYKHQLTVIDPSLEMINVGIKTSDHDYHCLLGTGENIPIKDNSADALTISFGIRNMTDMEQCINEIYRVLKPGGKFYCLEFSKPLLFIRPFYTLYNRYIIPRLGAIIAKQPTAYQYLIESIQRFPDQKEMKQLFEKAGFIDVNYKNLSFAISCIHSGMVPE